jgi:hypothetical protein
LSSNQPGRAESGAPFFCSGFVELPFKTFSPRAVHHAKLKKLALFGRSRKLRRKGLEK